MENDLFPFPVVRARYGRVVVLPRVTAPGLLSGVGKRTLRPVVRPRSRARLHLELVHTKVVRAERRVRYVRVSWRGALPIPRTVAGGRGRHLALRNLAA